MLYYFQVHTQRGVVRETKSSSRGLSAGFVATHNVVNETFAGEGKGFLYFIAFSGWGKAIIIPFILTMGVVCQCLMYYFC